MTNGQNIPRSRHLEELANAAKRYTLREILDVTNAVATELENISGDDVFTGATSIAGGLSGNVPAPAAGDEDKFLRGDGTWAAISGGGSSSSEIVLPTVTSSVDGGFWYDAETHALCVRQGNYSYQFANTGRIFVGDESDALVAYLPFDTNLSDVYGNEWTVNGNATLDTTIKKFGAASVHLTNGVYLEAQNILDITADKWTFDAWCYYNGGANNAGLIGFDCAEGVSNSGVQLLSSGIYIANSAGSGWQSYKNTRLPNTYYEWTHIAVVKDGMTYNFYQDGELIWTNTLTENPNTGGIFRLGGSAWGAQTDSYLSDVRFFDGVALWTSDFTPPTAEDYT